MHQIITKYSLSENGNPWWIAYHTSGMFYEIQINKETGNILFGMGPMEAMNHKLTIEEVMSDEKVHNEIRRNFGDEVLGEIKETCRKIK